MFLAEYWCLFFIKRLAEVFLHFIPWFDTTRTYRAPGMVASSTIFKIALNNSPFFSLAFITRGSETLFHNVSNKRFFLFVSKPHFRHPINAHCMSPNIGHIPAWNSLEKAVYIWTKKAFDLIVFQRRVSPQNSTPLAEPLPFRHSLEKITAITWLMSSYIAQITKNDFIIVFGESLKADITLNVIVIVVLVYTNFFIWVNVIIFLQIKNYDFRLLVNIYHLVLDFLNLRSL